MARPRAAQAGLARSRAAQARLTRPRAAQERRDKKERKAGKKVMCTTFTAPHGPSARTKKERRVWAALALLLDAAVFSALLVWPRPVHAGLPAPAPAAQAVSVQPSAN